MAGRAQSDLDARVGYLDADDPRIDDLARRALPAILRADSDTPSLSQ
jgi:hypothetical protein